MTRRRTEPVVEDPKRRLLQTCRHRAPACWPCVANDMERQRDAAEDALRRLEDLIATWTATAERYDEESNAPTKNDDERRTALAKFTAAVSLRDVAKHLRAVLSGGAVTHGNDANGGDK